MPKFSDTIAKWNKRQVLAMEAVIKESAQSLTEDVLKPRAKGGNMPVDTGFLRNSMAAAINSIPSGEPSDMFDMQPVVLTINKVKAGDRLVIGFTANYAKYMESRFFFVRHSVQDWPKFVTKATNKVAKALR